LELCDRGPPATFFWERWELEVGETVLEDNQKAEDTASGLSGHLSSGWRFSAIGGPWTTVSRCGGHDTHLPQTQWTPKKAGAFLLLGDSEKGLKAPQRLILSVYLR